MSKSVINNEHRCLICGTIFNLHRHHIYYGTANRKKSERWGCWCFLCAKHHNFSKHSVHFDHEMDLDLKKLCQHKLEESGWSRDRFIRTFGRNYLY